MSRPLRIGVIGSTSAVARLAVLPAIEASARLELRATASLSDPAATYPSYEALLQDDGVEAVYVPLPNSLHAEWTEKAAARGKHVLCEKPLAPTAGEAAFMARCCAEAGVVLMEAYMTAFHPREQLLGEVVASGRLGELLSARAEFTGVLARPDDHRYRPEMGGGALLDVGIYCLSPLLRAAGIEPASSEAVGVLAAAARRNERGVDTTFSGWLGLGNGRAGSFLCSFEAAERQLLSIVGTAGRIDLERAFTPGQAETALVLTDRDGAVRSLEAEGVDPYQAMLEHFAAVVAGEAPQQRPPAASVGLQRLLDRLREAAR